MSAGRLRAAQAADVLHGKKIVVVMPAYNAADTLAQTYGEIPPGYVDQVVLVDDASVDETARVARELGLETIVHPKNRGYGGNQKTCYRRALELGADVVVMLHPDYQYTPKLLVAMASLVAIGQYDIVLGSRILCGSALKGGMPGYKYVSNRVLTLVQNLIIGLKLSEYHTGYRAFSREVLSSLPLEENSDDFVFDNQMLVQAVSQGFSIGEISCPAKYFAEASSIGFTRSVRYGLGVLRTSVQFRLERAGLAHYPIFRADGGGRLVVAAGAKNPSSETSTHS
jgi:glycosyltransferase involved in cell wall biosynthesis